MQRFSNLRASILRSARQPELKKKAQNSWSAILDTYYSIKDTFERHRVVFTVGTSIASVATAWLGYTIRHAHEIRVDRRLQAIEQSMQKNKIEDEEIKKVLKSGSVGPATCAAAISLVLGYGLGWRGGRWYANRQFRKEQMKALGLGKQPRWKLQFMNKLPLARLKLPLSRLKLRGGKTTKTLADSSQIGNKPTKYQTKPLQSSS